MLITIKLIFLHATHTHTCDYTFKGEHECVCVCCVSVGGLVCMGGGADAGGMSGGGVLCARAGLCVCVVCTCGSLCVC